MKSVALGQPTSQVEVTNVSPHGFWLFVDDRELFVSFDMFPWFKEASIRAISNVTLPSTHHLYWPDLDVDLAVESLDHPDKFPLVSKVLNRTARAPKTRRKAATRLASAKRPRRQIVRSFAKPELLVSRSENCSLQTLIRDDAVNASVAGGVDLTHAAAAKRRDNGIWTQSGA